MAAQQIAVAYDFSPFARRALALALQGYTYGPDVIVKVVHVIDEHLYENVLSKSHVPSEDDIAAYLRADLARVEQELPGKTRSAPAPVLHIARGKPFSEILKAAAAVKARAVMMGGQGHGGLKEKFLGRTAQRVVREAPCPVYIVKEPYSASVPKRILCAVDYSEPSKKALEQAAALAKQSGAALSLLHVVENPYVPYLQKVAVEIHDEKVLRQLREDMQGELRKFEKSVLGGTPAGHHLAVFGNAAETVAQHAKILNAGTIVLGTHGHSPLGRAVLGSVAEGVLLHSAVDVLVVR